MTSQSCYRCNEMRIITAVAVAAAYSDVSAVIAVHVVAPAVQRAVQCCVVDCMALDAR